jgi:hypothetical protein
VTTGILVGGESGASVLPGWGQERAEGAGTTLLTGLDSDSTDVEFEVRSVIRLSLRARRTSPDRVACHRTDIWAERASSLPLSVSWPLWPFEWKCSRIWIGHGSGRKPPAE